ncbi:hypothetical protein BGZ80_008203 [Entomortierella chlamydospora]|uniref:Alkaline phosphatase n=1 Tax=Entomortierella chlamydospora TaxID=101097 RepID=A0A9P6MXQ3_9FUNG|nr:hypothetical protein BGZ79_010216 [Entomortierella chlamydospora]KAG0017518.1 hypothetical protein BGZ80_008203 [Entomortierella chlamydospora]
MMVSDGFGPASQTYARSYYQYVHSNPKSPKKEYVSPLDKILVGSSRTKSNSSLITDSAAGATAFSCSLKTYNGAVGVDPTGTPCGTILEAAKALGMLTGMVVTSRITDATPASFSSHVPHREMESEIAEQQIGDYVLGRQVDLMMGGGRCFFLPNTTKGSCRKDDRDLIKESQDNFDWKHVMLNRQEFLALDEEDEGIPLPAMGLFNQGHLSFEVDRDKSARGSEPSLKEMTKAALKSLKGNAGPNQGFFLLIEGSRIDLAAHNNDPVAHVHEILQYHEAVAVVRAFVANNPDTLLISTSDHETGGFTLGFQDDPNVYPEYIWKPEVIQAANASTEVLADKLVSYTGRGRDRRQFVRTVILDRGLGIKDPTDEELTFLADPASSHQDILIFLGRAISRRAYLGWTTIGHTGVDVNLYAEGDNVAVNELRGNHENTEIGAAMSKFLNVDLDYITRRLEKDVDRWFKPMNSFWRNQFGGRSSKHEMTGH